MPPSSPWCCQSSVPSYSIPAVHSLAQAAVFPAFESLDLSTEAWFWIAGSLLVLLTTVFWLFVHGDAGLILIAIRENEQRCQYLGPAYAAPENSDVHCLRVVAAIAGYVFACYSMVVSPELAGFVFGTELVIFTVLGGRGTLIGPVLGTIAVDYESAQLSGDYPFVWKLILGAAFVVVIVAFPRGLLPILTGAWRRMAGRVSPGRASAFSRACGRRDYCADTYRGSSRGGGGAPA